MISVSAVPPPYDQQVKRVRDHEHDEESWHQQQPMPTRHDSQQSNDCAMASPSSGKKQRPSTYQPPRHVDPKSLVAVTGSLVGGGWQQSTMSVKMRRELSGGQLDQFFRGNTHDDDMDSDDGPSVGVVKIRSMSF